jgi:hypothetical protein
VIEREHLNPTSREDLGHIEGRWSFFRSRIPRVLRRGLQNDTCAGDLATLYRTRVIEGLGVRVADLQTGTPARRVLA